MRRFARGKRLFSSSVDDLHIRGQAILLKHGCKQSTADNVMNVMLAAEARGFGGHGLIRLARIVNGIKAGTHFPNNPVEIDNTLPAILSVNGNHALGADVSVQITNRLMEITRRCGIGLATIRNITHFGFGGYYSEMAASQGLLGLVLANTEPGAAPFGGKGKVLGTNPISFSCPVKGSLPLTMDFATTAAARGRLVKAAMLGEAIPENLAIDKDGNPTTDPKEGLAGALCPLGGLYGYKGTGLALMIDILAGALTGSNTGKRVTGTASTDVPCTAGHMFLFLDPSVISPNHDDFIAQVKAVAEDLKQSGDAVLLPGEIEHRSQDRAKREGIKLSPELEAMLEELEQSL